MKILFYGDAFDYRVRQSVSYFSGKGHHTLLVSGPGSLDGQNKYPPAIEIKIIKDSISVPVLAHLSRLRQLKAIVRQFQPDLLFVDTVWPKGIYGAFSGFHPLLLSAWGSDIAINPEKSSFRRSLIRHALKVADIVRVHDDAARDRVMELGCEPSKVIIHVRGTDTEVFSPAVRPGSTRGELGLTGSIAVICIRKLNAYYDVATLVEAIPLVLNKIPEARFVICGEGKQKQMLEDRCAELGVSGKVCFTGNISHDEMPVYLANCDIFVDTFYTGKAGGGIGGGLMEAMSCGLFPVVASRPGIDFAVKDGHNGLYFEGGSHTGLAEKVIQVAGDEKMRRLFGQRNREYMLDAGNFKKNMEAFEEEILARLGVKTGTGAAPD